MFFQYLSAALFAYVSYLIISNQGVVFLFIGLIGVFCVSLCLPYTRKILHSVVPIVSPSKPVLSVVVAYCIFAVQVLINAGALNYQKEEAAAQERERISAERSKLEALAEQKNIEFKKDKDKIISDILESIKKGTPEVGLATGKEFIRFINDPELLSAVKKAEIASIRKEVASGTNFSAERAVEVYGKLLEEEPNNKTFKTRLATAKELVERDKDEQERVKFAAQAAKQFSVLDGSHPSVVEFVKKGMHNPDSFEHVRTSFNVPTGDAIEVTMTFRGTNAFGGVVTSTKSFTLNKSGRVVSYK